MIKQFFLPEQINGYYLFKKRVIALHATQSSWFALGLELYKREKKIFFIDQESFETSEKKLEALKALQLRLPYYHTLVTDADPYYLIFKELVFPNLERDKISLVLPSELEQSISFPLNQIESSFTLFQHDTKKYALVTVIQKKHLEELEHFFQQASLTIDSFVPLIISMYGLFQNKINKDTINLLVIFDRDVIYISTIKHGVLSKIRTVLQANGTILSEKLQFTFSSLLEEEGIITHCYCLGNMPDIIKNYLKETISQSIQLLHVHDINGIEFEKLSSQESFSLPALALCYPSSLLQDSILKSDQAKQKDEKNIFNSIVLISILLLSSISLFSVITVMQVQKLSQQIKERNNTITDIIKKNFKKTKKSITLREIIKNAQKEIEQEEKVWLPFFQQTHQSFLKDLLTLSTHIDAQVLGLEIKRMVLTKNTMNIEGNVRNFEAIEEFEKQLKATKLFKRIPDLQETQFSLILPFAEKGESV